MELCDGAGPSVRQVLHVQSISAWAPSCIGPYSQATAFGSLVHMAGQIGLDPPTMQLVDGGCEPQVGPLASLLRFICVYLAMNGQ
jgi:diphthine-ammonia ligase